MLMVQSVESDEVLQECVERCKVWTVLRSVWRGAGVCGVLQSVWSEWSGVLQSEWSTEECVECCRMYEVLQSRVWNVLQNV